jgi:Domain of unknown function (DUF5668)
MKCAVHQEVDAIAYCRNCGKALCTACARPVRDVIYCEDCLAAHLGLTAPPPATEAPADASGAPGFVASAERPYAPNAAATPVARTAPHTGNATVAFVLGLFPGLGAVYNGEYNKALIHIVVFSAMIVGLNSELGDSAETALSLLLAGFVLYMAFDAMRTAKARAMGQTGVDPLETWSKDRPIGPIILIGLGVVFLLNSFSWFSFYRVQRLWPLILIAAGVLMFRNRISRDF